LTASGHPRAIFERAIQRHNLLVAETVLRTEIPKPTLRDQLELTALIATKDPRRFSRVATRWLLKYLDAVEDVTIDAASYAAANLQALAGRQHEQALTALRELADQCSLRVVR
jgi:hypothetical protein